MSETQHTGKPVPFELHADQTLLSRIARRVAEYEWPPAPHGAGWELGAEPATMRYLVDRWAQAFDWRAEEASLNRLPHYRAEVDGLALHFVHLRAQGSGSIGLPVVLLHGWPGSFLEYIEVAGKLATGPEGRDVVILSLPGAGYSQAPDRLLGPRAIAALIDRLMGEVLGYSRYVAHGSDWGSLVSAWMGFDHAQRCAGVHMTMASPRFIAGAAKEPDEQQWLAGFRERFEDDGAYFRLQTSRPLTAGYLLADNPVGLLAWMLEKFAAWGDPAEGDRSRLFQTPERADRLLRNVMLYMVTRSAATSTWIYRGLAAEGPPGYPGGARVEVPVAFAATRDPVFVPPPRSLLEKVYRIVRYTDLQGGGHFPGYDVPGPLAHDIAQFAASL